MHLQSFRTLLEPYGISTQVDALLTATDYQQELLC